MKKPLIIFATLALLTTGIIAFIILDRADTDGEESQIPPGEERRYNWSTMSEGPYGDQISFATSDDLLHWTDSGEILAQHASVPDAIVKDGVIYVYFVDVTQDGEPEQIGLVRSYDGGETWTERVITEIEGLGEKVAVDPDPFLLEDGRIRLYYFDIESNLGGGSCKIYSAISEDGIHFTEEPGIRFERDLCALDPDVIKVGGTYRMYLGGNEGKIILATSADGLNFTEEGAVFDGGVPNVFHDGDKYILYTMGINIAFSKDGKEFTKQDYSFQSMFSPLTADPGVIQIGESNYLMVFKTKIP